MLSCCFVACRVMKGALSVYQAFASFSGGTKNDDAINLATKPYNMTKGSSSDFDNVVWVFVGELLSVQALDSLKMV